MVGTKQASRTSPGALLAAVVVVIAVITLLVNGGLPVHAPTSAAAPTGKPAAKKTSDEHAIDMHVTWYTDELPDNRAGEISIVWRLEGFNGKGQPETAIKDANRRVWSLAHEEHASRGLKYDGVSAVYVAASGPVELTCHIIVDGVVRSYAIGRKVTCQYPVPAH